MSALSDAQQYIADSNSGKVQWDDNKRAQANNLLSGSGSGSNDPFALAQKMIQMQQDANKPAVESLQAQIPEIQAKYGQARSQLQASQPSLEQQYSNILDEIKGKQTADVNAQTRVTAGELGKRGITGSSTLAGQEIQNAVQPINTQYATLTNNTSLAKEDAIRQLQDSIANLTPEETADERAISNAIASLQAGASSQGISQGLNLYSTNLQNQTEQQQLQLQAQQLAAQQAYQNADLGIRQTMLPYQIAQSGAQTGLIGAQTGLTGAQTSQYGPVNINGLRDNFGIGNSGYPMSVNTATPNGLSPDQTAALHKFWSGN
jgi:hypothetical protein